jgi:hypothetical protein
MRLREAVVPSGEITGTARIVYGRRIFDGVPYRIRATSRRKIGGTIETELALMLTLQKTVTPVIELDHGLGRFEFVVTDPFTRQIKLGRHLPSV